jgi:Tfp pilus assembly protein PilO
MVLSVALCALAGWGYFLSDLLPFGHQRLSKRNQELSAARETVATELEKARRSVGNLPQLEKEHRELERKWKQAERLLPTDKEMAELLTSITQAGEQAGVEFQSFKPGPQRPQEFYNENPVDIQVKGGFHQVGVFLARVANLPRIVSVSGLSLDATKQKSRAGRGKRDRNEAKDDTENSDHTLVASFTATAFSLRDPSQPLPAAGPAEKGGRIAKSSGKGGKGGGAGHGDTQAASVAPGNPKASPGATTKRLSVKAKQPVEGAQ